MTPRVFRKKPVLIQAVRFDEKKGQDIARWCNARYICDAISPIIEISTLEGIMSARTGDWIVRGMQGEFYLVKDSIFRECYEEEG